MVDVSEYDDSLNNSDSQQALSRRKRNNLRRVKKANSKALLRVSEGDDSSGTDFYDTAILKRKATKK